MFPSFFPSAMLLIRTPFPNTVHQRVNIVVALLASTASCCIHTVHTSSNSQVKQKSESTKVSSLIIYYNVLSFRQDQNIPELGETGCHKKIPCHVCHSACHSTSETYHKQICRRAICSNGINSARRPALARLETEGIQLG